MKRLGARSTAASILMVSLTTWMAWAQTPRPAATATPPGPAPAVATVGGRRISRAEFDQRSAAGMAEFKRRNGSDIPAELQPAVRRQLLETLIRRELLVLEVQRRGLAASAAEAEEQIKRDPFFQLNGTFNEAKYLAIKQTSPAAFAAGLKEMQLTIGARRLEEKLESELGAEEPRSDSTLSRALSRASVDVLALRRGEFSGDYPEPRESEILDYYRAHQADYRRPDRAVLSLIFVDPPTTADSAVAHPAAQARLRTRADSVLAAIRHGGAFEAAAVAFSSVRSNVVIVPGNLPGYWRGNERTTAALFESAPGTVYPEPVASATGWMLVRVDQVQRSRVAPLGEVSKEIRSRMRSDRRLHYESDLLHALYRSDHDSLITEGYRVRYALFDTTRMQTGDPTPADLDHFYRAHLADYTQFDNRTGSVTEQPLAQVEQDVRNRWRRERRVELALQLSQQLRDAWSRGRRDQTIERMVTVREGGPVPLGTAIDSTQVGHVLGDTLEAREGARGVGIATTPRGTVVFQVLDPTPHYLPTFDQAHDRLLDKLNRRRNAEFEAAAHHAYDASPADFLGSDIIHHSRLIVASRPPIEVPLTRQDVLRYHEKHIDDFSAPEAVRLSHILITPRDRTPAADREALEKAQSLLKRARDGEDFAELARNFTDDEATRANGGDLGQVKRGALLDPVEKAAFALRAGQLSDVVKSDAGYHILKVFEYLPRIALPLEQIYSNVGMQLAKERGDSLAGRTADSLRRILRTPQQARAVAQRMGLGVVRLERTPGERGVTPDLLPYFRAIDRTPVGEFVPGTQYVDGVGWVITWVDSISHPKVTNWQRSRDQVIDLYRQAGGARAVAAKRAELDSMMAAGWSFDSLGTLFGGLQHVDNVTMGNGIPGVTQSTRFDSLIFGLGGKPLAAGQVSPWVSFSGGAARLQLAARNQVAARDLARESARQQGIERERRMQKYFATLKARYAVRILDARLREVELPPLPPPGAVLGNR